jgi:flagellar basal body-associated protein FliL
MGKLLGGKKKFILLGLLVLVLGVGYKMTSSKAAPKLKIKGTVYEMPASFLLNLAGDQYAKLNVALLLAPGQPDEAPGAKTSSSAGAEGEVGTLPEEAVIRSIITNAVTGESKTMLIDERGRIAIKARILRQIEKQTDVKVESVLFPDLTVQ